MNTKITLKLIDGKPVPHVWMMPKKKYSEALALSELEYQKEYEEELKAIIYARENAVPVKEEFRHQVIYSLCHCHNCRADECTMEPSLTKDYDVDMEFEIINVNDKKYTFDFDSGYWFNEDFTDQKTHCPQIEVAIPKQIKEVEPIKEQKEHDCTEYAKIDCKCPKGVCNYQPTESGEGKDWKYEYEVLKEIQLFDERTCGELVHQLKELKEKHLSEIHSKNAFIIQLKEKIEQLESVAPTDEGKEDQIKLWNEFKMNGGTNLSLSNPRFIDLMSKYFIIRKAKD